MPSPRLRTASRNPLDSGKPAAPLEIELRLVSPSPSGQQCPTGRAATRREITLWHASEHPSFGARAGPDGGGGLPALSRYPDWEGRTPNPGRPRFLSLSWARNDIVVGWFKRAPSDSSAANGPSSDGMHMAMLHVIVVALRREAHATAATLHSARTMRSFQERACQRLAAVAPWCRRAAGPVGVQGRGAGNWAVDAKSW
jgi:hypothetical protein